MLDLLLLQTDIQYRNNFFQLYCIPVVRPGGGHGLPCKLLTADKTDILYIRSEINFANFFDMYSIIICIGLGKRTAQQNIC